MSKDTRIVYGVGCTWWDGIDKIGHTPKRDGVSLPACPHCGSVLFEMENEREWFDRVDKHEERGNPGYRKMIEWARGKCFPNYKAVQSAYAAEQTPDQQ